MSDLCALMKIPVKETFLGLALQDLALQDGKFDFM